MKQSEFICMELKMQRLALMFWSCRETNGWNCLGIFVRLHYWQGLDEVTTIIYKTNLESTTSSLIYTFLAQEFQTILFVECNKSRQI